MKNIKYTNISKVSKVLAVAVTSDQLIIKFFEAEKTFLYFGSFRLFMEQGKREIWQNM